MHLGQVTVLVESLHDHLAALDSTFQVIVQILENLVIEDRTLMCGQQNGDVQVVDFAGSASSKQKMWLCNKTSTTTNKNGWIRVKESSKKHAHLLKPIK